MELAVYGMGAGGVAIALAAAFALVMRRINADMFTTMLLKLIAAGNPDRARKLCAAASMSPFGRIAAAILAAHAAAPADLGSGLAADSMREAFARSRDQEMKKLTRVGWLGLLGSLLATGSMALAATHGIDGIWLLGPGPAGAALALWTWRTIGRTGKEAAQHGPRIIEALAA
jgi:hypothetical protein